MSTELWDGVSEHREPTALTASYSKAPFKWLTSAPLAALDAAVTRSCQLKAAGTVGFPKDNCALLN